MAETMQIVATDENNERKFGFSPARDIAYFHHQLLEKAVIGLKRDNWEPWIRDYLAFAKVSEADVMRAFAAYCKFCKIALIPQDTGPGEDLEAAGFFKCPKAAQLVVCAKIGQVSTGAWWAGIKSAVEAGKVQPVIEHLLQYAEEVEQLLNDKWSSNAPTAQATEGAVQ